MYVENVHDCKCCMCAYLYAVACRQHSMIGSASHTWSRSHRKNTHFFSSTRALPLFQMWINRICPTVKASLTLSFSNMKWYAFSLSLSFTHLSMLYSLLEMISANVCEWVCLCMRVCIKWNKIKSHIFCIRFRCSLSSFQWNYAPFISYRRKFFGVGVPLYLAYRSHILSFIRLRNMRFISLLCVCAWLVCMRVDVCVCVVYVWHTAYPTIHCIRETRLHWISVKEHSTRISLKCLPHKSSMNIYYNFCFVFENKTEKNKKRFILWLCR